LTALVKGLPRDALVRTPESERGRDPWTAELELMAQLVEITSIAAAEMKLKKPIQVPRPHLEQAAQDTARQAGRQVAAVDAPNPFRGAMAVMAGAAGGGGPTPTPRGGDGTDPAFGSAIAMLRGGGAER
jgi:hypothetical protein